MIAWAPAVVLLAGMQMAPPPPSPSPSPSSSSSALSSASPSPKTVAPSTKAADADAVRHVPKWSVYELALTASDRDEDPYVEVDLIGVFTGPDGESIVVGGFWDGQRTYRVRFTPPAEGTWTFATVSSDPKLDGQLGSFICDAPADGEHGFVRGGAAAQTAWTFDDGAPAWSALQVVRVRAPIVQDELTATIANISYAYGQAAAAGADARVGAHAHADAQAGVQAGVQAGAEAGADADDNQPDSMQHDRLDLLMLRDADRAVQESQKNGTIAEVELFDPSEPASIDEAEAHRLLDYLIARYGAYPNVVWCLHHTNAQSDDENADGWNAIANAVQVQDPYFSEGNTLRVMQLDCAAPAPGAKPTPTPTALTSSLERERVRMSSSLE